MKMLWIASALFLLSAVGCGSSEGAPKEGATSSTRIQLTAPGDESHALYRLGPATFRIEEQYSATPAPPIRVSTDVNADTLEVPLKQGYYTITLEDGWVLQSDYQGVTSPVEATLISANPQSFSVYDFRATSIQFNFALGISKLVVGIGVSEGDNRPPGYIPAGYDGAIEAMSDGRYDIVFAGGGGGACCWTSPAAAQAAYPDERLYVR